MNLEDRIKHNDGFATKKRILRLIVKKPGIHMRGIMKELKMSNGSVGYGLKCMEEDGIIKSERDDIYRRYYAIKKKLPYNFHIGKQSVAVAELIKSNEGANMTDIAHTIGTSWPAAYYHKKRLETAGEL
ncbi:MAG TPA: winged helix-turn-helix transcriptional regulator [Candidatus Nanoarchaeia archaeon]|nr:winged helix-turn-helix transcriptional regulator [Candidatus Nanoarchaeia archaeon]